MKKIITTAMVTGAILFSTNVFADKIIIKGEPIILEKQGEVYIVPQTYKVQEYQYAVIDGTKRACFLDKIPDLQSVDVVSIDTQLGDQKATWNCYALDPSHFTIE